MPLDHVKTLSDKNIQKWQVVDEHVFFRPGDWSDHFLHCAWASNNIGSPIRMDLVTFVFDDNDLATFVCKLTTLEYRFPSVLITCINFLLPLLEVFLLLLVTPVCPTDPSQTSGISWLPFYILVSTQHEIHFSVFMVVLRIVIVVLTLALSFLSREQENFKKGANKNNLELF